MYRAWQIRRIKICREGLMALSVLPQLSSSLMYVFPLIFGVALYPSFGIYKAIASFAYGLMICGLLRRSERAEHWVYMGIAMATDLGLVLSLELSRSAVETALGFKLGLGPQLHILFSLCAVLLYAPAIYFGYRRYRFGDSPRFNGVHKYLGLAIFGFRTLGFILMFSLKVAS